MAVTIYYYDEPVDTKEPDNFTFASDDDPDGVGLESTGLEAVES